MAYLMDSGFLYAIIDKKDDNHQQVVNLLPNLSREDVILPTIVLVEVTYLVRVRQGHRTMNLFIDTVYKSPWLFECLKREDMVRISELLATYSDLELDFVDASITALAERLNIQKILTVDRRDFGTIRPKHCNYFQILPG